MGIEEDLSWFEMKREVEEQSRFTYTGCHLVVMCRNLRGLKYLQLIPVGKNSKDRTQDSKITPFMENLRLERTEGLVSWGQCMFRIKTGRQPYFLHFNCRDEQFGQTDVMCRVSSW